MTGIEVREAREGDIGAIREIFMESYGPGYPYQYFYDEDWLKRSVYGDHLVMVVAVDRGSHEVLGTGSVVFDIGAHSDLIGEFGRLAVRKEARGQGVAKKIMARRIELIEGRLHVALVDNRTNHPYSQMISSDFEFAPVGFMPIKHRFHSGERESIATFARHFGPALDLRQNHPRVIPEVAAVAYLAMENLGLECDVIVDESRPAYGRDDDFEFDELEAEGVPHLLRIERGRVRKRDVFGPMQLNYGFFKLAAREASYLLARRPGMPKHAIAGAIGYLHDEYERNIRVFELIAASDRSIRHLFVELLRRARDLEVEYIEIDVAAGATRLQRTLLELDFLAAAYVPAMVFHEVERLDVVKMVRVFADVPRDGLHLVDSMEPLYQLVMEELSVRTVAPVLAEGLEELSIFDGLSQEQARRIAAAMKIVEFDKGEALFEQGGVGDALFVLLDGGVEVSRDPGGSLAHLESGEVVGENAMLAEIDHTATVTAVEPTTTAVLGRKQLGSIIRRRPDVAVVLYRNLAVSLGQKLRRTGVDQE